MGKKLLVTVLVTLAALVSAAILFACSQTPTSVPVRTFERAQRMDVVCLKVLDPLTGNPVVPEPRRQEECIPVPPNLNGGNLENQLYALVTQSSRGEIAVVNLSSGFLVDQKRATPGINFLPVGKLPTDIAVTPDGQMAFVGASEPNKAALYGVPTRRILGDTTNGRPADPDGPVTLASWPVCALPQNPGAITIVPRRKDAQPLGDAGAPAPDTYDYEIVVVLPGDQRSSAKVITLDPRPFLRGAKIAVAGDAAPGDPDAGAAPAVLAPGSLAPCDQFVTSAVELVGQSAVPATLERGATWSDGISYVDGGANIVCDRPRAGGCSVSTCCGGAATAPVATDGGADGGTTSGTVSPANDAGVGCNDETDAAAPPLNLGALDAPRLVAAVRDDQTLYIADANQPLIHVVDLSTPFALKELPPFVATSSANPSRAVSIRDLAVSPATHDYKRFLYAVDRDEGSILVYDVTDPANASREPLRRPHTELNPFQPEDRIAFSSPVVAVSFARHDYPLHQINGQPIPDAKTGVICNPNPNLTADNAARDYGFYYRASSGDPDYALDPRRLRGIFAFATLANGQVVAIDVDDWDAPCRRPGFMGAGSFSSAGRTDLTQPPPSSLAVPEPAPSGSDDLDPYHAPIAPPNAVSDEIFYPVSTPHRMRSDSLLVSDVRGGLHVPRLDGTPAINANGVPLAFAGPGADKTPLILPTATALPTTAADGTLSLVSALGVSFAHEVPDVHVDQDWKLSYEGVIPGFEGVSAVVKTEQEQNGGPVGDYDSLVLAQPEGRFCARGVEDWSQGGERANRISLDLQSHGGTAPEGLDRQIVDYVQLDEDLLDPGDPYWNTADDPGSCWGGLPPGAARYNACAATYGAAVDQSTQRDFPVLEAYQDRLVVGRFVTAPDGTRRVVYKDPSNAAYLKLMRCCFHHQVKFNVRTAGVWSLVGFSPGGGPGVGFLSHLDADPAGRCVPSCDARQSLLNSRAPAIPGSAKLTPPDRNSPIALRNPMFSFWMLDGLASTTNPVRDTSYVFHTRGQFSPLSVNIGATTYAVNPQSMRFIETLGQIAVVDAASQGLVLIDLGGVAIARAPYF
jgi:hypothetical protein